MLPHEIEIESFRIIQEELGPHNFSAPILPIVLRVIHTTADFEFRDLLRFSSDAIASGLTAINNGCNLVTDVRMVEAGISTARLKPLGGKVICDIAHPEVIQQSHSSGLTRATFAMRRNAASIHGGIAVIGNAPTALFEVLRLIREEGVRPALIIGVPVGFVNAAESKAELMEVGISYITAAGRKGGSTVAAAIVNALIRLTEAQ